MDWFKTAACEEVDLRKNDLFKLSNKLWKMSHIRREAKEAKPMESITRILKKNNFRITYNLQRMPNTFKAEYGTQSSATDKKANVAFLCRYDVTGKRSQFEGNNLSAEAAVAAALGVKAVLLFSCPTIGKVTVIGCPDTLDGGAATLVNLKVFKGIDVVMLAIPGPRTDWCPLFPGREAMSAVFTGEAGNSDVSLSRCDERFACMLAYQNLLSMDEHLDKGWTMKATYGRTGFENKCKTLVSIAAPTMTQVSFMDKRALPCLNAAATATGCECDIRLVQKTYYNFNNNQQMCYLLQLNAYHCGTLATPLKTTKTKPVTEAVDIGNVSHIVPTMMPMFYIGTEAEIGTPEFKKALRSQTAQPYTIAIGKALAMTAIDILNSSCVLETVKNELSGVLTKEKNSKFKPFPKPKTTDYVLKTDLPYEGNVGWSKRTC